MYYKINKASQMWKFITKSTRSVKCGNLLQNQQGQLNVKMYYKINKASQMWKFITKSTRSVKCENLFQNQQGQSNMKIYYKIVSIFVIYSFEANHSESKTDTFLLNKNNDTPPPPPPPLPNNWAYLRIFNYSLRKHCYSDYFIFWTHVFQSKYVDLALGLMLQIRVNMLLL